MILTTKAAPPTPLFVDLHYNSQHGNFTDCKLKESEVLLVVSKHRLQWLLFMLSECPEIKMPVAPPVIIVLMFLSGLYIITLFILALVNSFSPFDILLGIFSYLFIILIYTLYRQIHLGIHHLRILHRERALRLYIEGRKGEDHYLSIKAVMGNVNVHVGYKGMFIRLSNITLSPYNTIAFIQPKKKPN